MPISHNYKIIFVHIPKTGGTSIEYALDMHKFNPYVGLFPYRKQKRDYEHLFGKELQHYTLKEIEDFFKSCNFKNYKKFSRMKFIIDKTLLKTNFKLRNKISNEIFEKVNSYYKFTIVRNPYDRLVSYFAWLNKKWYNKIEIDKNEFRLFINKIYENVEFRNKKHLLPQHVFIENTSYFSIDKIIHFEDINNEFAVLSKSLNLDSYLPKRMISFHKEFEYYYDNISQEKVYKMYQKDFTLFDFPK